MQYLYMISFSLIIIGFLILIISFIKNQKNNKWKLKKRKSAKFAVIIPARNEALVIEDLLKSLQPQMNTQDIYIIVEKQSDKTVKIANKYNANIFIRPKFSKEKQRKGYALDECFKYLIKEKKDYDLYFIFDADNVVKHDYINQMLEIYKQGYQIAAGYRNIKNNDNVCCTCSGLTFSIINSLINEIKNETNHSNIIMGTGYYIDASLIKKWKGFPFYSLTEDYELSLYCSEHNISTYYNNKAEFYDEQPTDMKTSIIQRTRWIKGFMESRKNKIKNIKNDYERKIGIIPHLLMLLGVALHIFISSLLVIIYFILQNPLFIKYLIYLLLCLLFLYLILFIITYITIIHDIEKLNMSGKNILKTLFFNPIFLLSYIICFIKALKVKDLDWIAIEHNKTM